jgi:ribulose-5-phosphate 4-epimerase/fuculose-1-phosphate aldolase
MTEAEWQQRINLAACYRLVSLYGWDDLVDTHISARVPGPDHHFLINPYGLMFDEITASSLVKIDLDGNIVAPSDWPVNPPGFVIHSAIHGAREDAHCVVHTHTTAGVAVSCLENGLLPLNQFALEFHGRVAYHGYEGIATDLSERERLVRDLGSHPAMILRNHGLLTVGRTVGEAFYYMYYLEQACRVQLAAQNSGDKLVLPGQNLTEHAAGQFDPPGSPTKGDRLWRAMRRLADRLDPGYRD